MVRNKTPNPQQVTAEQLLREAVDRQEEDAKPPKQRIADEDELQMYKVRKRKEFEDHIRRQRQNVGTWIKYAQWEASQQEFRRARSIFERALHVEYQNVSLWLKYLEMEMKNKFVNHARNLFDRVCQLLPRVDQFWYKYAYMEELLGNYAGARTVFDRWMSGNPKTTRGCSTSSSRRGARRSRKGGR
jgi:crooked neck